MIYGIYWQRTIDDLSEPLEGRIDELMFKTRPKAIKYAKEHKGKKTYTIVSFKEVRCR